MKAEARRRLMLLGALVVGGSALGVIASGALDDNLVYFWTPSELQENSDKAQNVVVRLGGQVKPESKNWDPDARHLEFVMTDGDTEVAVEFNGDLPEMFREGVGVVVEGTMGSDGVFRISKEHHGVIIVVDWIVHSGISRSQTSFENHDLSGIPGFNDGHSVNGAGLICQGARVHNVVCPHHQT